MKKETAEKWAQIAAAEIAAVMKEKLVEIAASYEKRLTETRAEMSRSIDLINARLDDLERRL